MKKEDTKEKKNVCKLLRWACVLFLTAFAVTFGEAGVTAYAAERVTAKDIQANQSDQAELAAVKDGICKGSDGYYYYYDNGALVKKTGWLLANGKLKIKLDSNYRVQYKMVGGIYKFPGNDKTEFVGKYVSAFDKSAGKFVGLSDDVVRLDDGQMYYVNTNGSLFYSVNTNKSDKKGNIYLLRTYTSCGDNRDATRSVVKGKLVKRGNIVKCYTYIPSTDKWCMVRNLYKNISGTTYYFNNNGIAIQKIVTGTGKGKSEKLYVYKNSQWKLVRNSAVTFPMNITTLEEQQDGMLRVDDSKTMSSVDIPNRVSAKNNKLYFFTSDGTKALASKWYNAADGTKMYVSIKGYVTKKYSPKTKMMYSYDYSRKEWSAITGKVYKETIGITTYYFGKNGKAYKTYRKKCNHRWYQDEYFDRSRMICNGCGKDETDMGGNGHELSSGIYFFKASDDYYWWGNTCPISWHSEQCTYSIRWKCYYCHSTILIEGTRKPTAKDY